MPWESRGTLQSALGTRLYGLEQGTGVTPRGVGLLATLPSAQLSLWARKYAAARAGVGTVNVWLMGSSTMEGDGAGTFATTAAELLARSLRGSTRGMTSVQPGEVNTFTDYPVDFYGATAGIWNGAESSGIGRSGVLRAAADGLTYTFTGTSVKVGYGQYSGGPNITIKIDGVTVATVNSGSPASTDRYVEWTSSALTRGSHTVSVEHAGGSSAFAYIRLLRGFDGDESAGVRVIGAGRAGWGAADLSANTAQWGPATDDLLPDLVVLAIGINDYRSGTPRTAEYVRGHLQTAIDRIKTTAADAAFAITIPPEPSGGTSSDSWATWATMYATLATTNSGIAVDERDLIPAVGQTGAPYQGDNVHLNPTGQAIRARIWGARLGCLDATLTATPVLHADRHATGGADAVSPASIGAAATSHTHPASDVASGTLAIARVPTGTTSTTVSLGNHTHTASLVPFAPVTFTDGATITLDASLGTFFRGSLGGDRLLAVPTSGTDGQRLLVEALASSAERTLTINASILRASPITSPITIPSGKRWFGGLLLSSGTWYLIASTVQG